MGRLFFPQKFKNNGWTDTYRIVHRTEDPGFTFHAFKGPGFADSSKCDKMDWVFVRGDMNVVDAKVIDEDYQGRFPSDHYFVLAEVKF